MKEIAMNYYKQGFSCSEAVVRAAHEQGLISKDINLEQFNSAASAFSGGLGHGRLCGAVSGCLISLGLAKGRTDQNQSPSVIKNISKDFVQEFKNKRKFTCCGALSRGFEFDSPERKENCHNIVGDAFEAFEAVLNDNKIDS